MYVSFEPRFYSKNLSDRNICSNMQTYTSRYINYIILCKLQERGATQMSVNGSMLK